MNNAKDLVMISIGPIQSYITTARKTQDLYAASQILSLFSQTACQEAQKHHCEIIYPSNINSTEGTPNHIVFLASAGKGSEVAREICKKIEEERERYSNQVKDYLKECAGGKVTYNDPLWDAQIQDWLELYWVSVAWDGLEANYPQTYHTASLALDGRKGVRWYPKAQEGNSSCTLCGLRSPVFSKRNIQKYAIPESILREQERLCAVCLIKRLLPRIDSTSFPMTPFPSTASIATTRYREEIEILALAHQEIKNLNSKLKAIIQELGLSETEGVCYFPDFWDAESIANETGKNLSPEKINQASDTLRALNEHLAQYGARFSRPKPYYAVLSMDGDHMGKLLDSADSIERHRQISAALAELATSFSQIIQDNLGKVVFSGGDDLLALLPVDTVLVCASAISKAFHDKFVAIGFPDVSMSAGIAIGHYNAPLQATIQKARSALDIAKTVWDRNALVMEVAKRSGESRQVGIKWNFPPEKPTPLENIQSFIEAISGGKVSGKLAYELWEELPALTDSPDNPSFNWFRAELSRLLKRHSQEGWKTEAELKEWTEQLCNLWDYLSTKASKAEQITQWLLVSRFLAEGEPL